jgi:hypothetical protein
MEEHSECASQRPIGIHLWCQAGSSVRCLYDSHDCTSQLQASGSVQTCCEDYSAPSSVCQWEPSVAEEWAGRSKYNKMLLEVVTNVSLTWTSRDWQHNSHAGDTLPSHSCATYVTWLSALQLRTHCVHSAHTLVSVCMCTPVMSHRLVLCLWVDYTESLCIHKQTHARKFTLLEHISTLSQCLRRAGSACTLDDNACVYTCGYAEVAWTL